LAVILVLLIILGVVIVRRISRSSPAEDEIATDLNEKVNSEPGARIDRSAAAIELNLQEGERRRHPPTIVPAMSMAADPPRIEEQERESLRREERAELNLPATESAESYRRDEVSTSGRYGDVAMRSEPEDPRRQAMPGRLSEVSNRNPNRGARTYTAAEGDTLFDIARSELGRASRWVEIYELNRDALGKDFDLLPPGTQLALPEEASPTADPITRRPVWNDRR
jgi:nucleoid-associated protein YgaU